MPRFLIAASLVAVTFAGTAFAQGQDARKAASAKITGSKHYQAFCVDCHGKTGAGDGNLARTQPRPVPNFTTPQAIVDYSNERMMKGVAAGHDDATRATWQGKLDEDAIHDTVAFLREAFMLPAPVEDASAGRSIYAKTCSVCHGDRGDGASWARTSLNPSPRDFTDPKTRELSRRHMINTVTYGSPQTAMKGFSIQLSREQIAAVVDYIRATFVYPGGVPENDGVPKTGNDRHAAHGHTSAGPADMSLPMPKNLVADAAWGKQFFDNNCATCHGKKGDGQGPRAYFINPKPANFTAPEARVELNRPNLFDRIGIGSRGTEMPAWSKVLSEQEIANVAEYVFATFIVPEPPAEEPPAEQKKK